MQYLIRVIGWSNPANIVLNICIVSLFANAVAASWLYDEWKERRAQK